MTADSRAGETAARTYARLLLDLHDLIARGLGDGEEADTVRDQMDAPGRP